LFNCPIIPESLQATPDAQPLVSAEEAGFLKGNRLLNPQCQSTEGVNSRMLSEILKKLLT